MCAATRLLALIVTLSLCMALGADATAGEVASSGTATSAASAQQMKTAAAAAAVVAAERSERPPDFLELLVDSVLELFDIRSSGNTTMHYVVSALLLVVGLLARWVVAHVLFPAGRRLAANTKTTLDDKLFPALERPVASLVMVVGIFAALKVLKLSPEADLYIGSGARVALALSVFWILWRGLAAMLEHAQEVSRARGSAVAAFMPWIRKTLLTVFAIFAVLLTLQSLGYNVKAILAGLGIGGLAFALAAQDTLANVFGAVVVAVDQPFRLGEAVRIGQNAGSVEDVGIRSTRIRLSDKSLMIVPNKTVAAEAITNLSRFTRRRIEQVFSFPHATTPEQMTELVEAVRGIVAAQPEVDKNGVMVFFRDVSASSLDIWLVYETTDPDFQKSMRCRQRVNLEIMKAVRERNLSFALPAKRIHFRSPVGQGLGAFEPEKDAPDARV